MKKLAVKFVESEMLLWDLQYLIYRNLILNTNIGD